MSICQALDHISRTLPGIKKIVLDKPTWSRLLEELSRIHRFSEIEDLPSGIYEGCLFFRDIEILESPY